MSKKRSRNNKLTLNSKSSKPICRGSSSGSTVAISNSNFYTEELEMGSQTNNFIKFLITRDPHCMLLRASTEKYLADMPLSTWYLSIKNTLKIVKHSYFQSVIWPNIQLNLIKSNMLSVLIKTTYLCLEEVILISIITAIKVTIVIVTLAMYMNFLKGCKCIHISQIAT